MFFTLAHQTFYIYSLLHNTCLLHNTVFSDIDININMFYILSNYLYYFYLGINLIFLIII